jgi:hypothetical protein
MNTQRTPTQTRQASSPTSLRETWILDTNILFLWLAHRSGIPPYDDYEIERRQAAVRLVESPTRQADKIVIPAIVWIELCGLFLQKDIDPFDYALWRRKRQSALAPLTCLLFQDTQHPLCIGEEPLPHELAHFLCNLEATPQTIERWQNQRERAEANGKQKVIKGLDGIDSAILAYAWSYAAQKLAREQREQVFLITDDRGLGHTLNDLRKRRISFADQAFPQNLSYLPLLKPPQRRPHNAQSPQNTQRPLTNQPLSALRHLNPSNTAPLAPNQQTHQETIPPQTEPPQARSSSQTQTHQNPREAEEKP